jgi:hypothetical protein
MTRSPLAEASVGNNFYVNSAGPMRLDVSPNKFFRRRLGTIDQAITPLWL